MNVTLISPHYDDIAFSLSLFLADRIPAGWQFTLVNCFTRSDYNLLEGANLSIEENSELRAKEDRLFAASFTPPLARIDLNLNDAPLRIPNKNHRPFGSPEDEGTFEHLRQHIAGCSWSNVLLPLSIGDHIDHVMVWECFLRYFPERIVGFYEDLPYAGMVDEDEIRRKKELAEQALEKVLVPEYYGNPSYAAKEERCLCYPSQLCDEINASIRKHFEHLNKAERLWWIPNIS